jgi:hypothetical protein
MGPVFDVDFSWMIWLVVCLLLDFPLLFGAILLWARWRSHNARNWSMAIGRIMSAEVKTIKRRSKIRFAPEVIYEYEVDGKLYQGKRLNFGFQMQHNIRSWAEEGIAAYTVGQQVEVYYNPDKPQDSVLEIAAPVGKPVKLMLLIAVGSTVMALVMFVVIFGLVSRPN